MNGMEGDVIHGVYESLVFGIRGGIASMAFEREIAPEALSELGSRQKRKWAYCESFSSTYLDGTLMACWLKIWPRKTHWIATLPSTLPTAKPLLMGDVVKHEITRVCHFRGDTMV